MFTLTKIKYNYTSLVALATFSYFRSLTVTYNQHIDFLGYIANICIIAKHFVRWLLNKISALIKKADHHLQLQLPPISPQMDNLMITTSFL